MSSALFQAQGVMVVFRNPEGVIPNCIFCFLDVISASPLTLSHFLKEADRTFPEKLCGVSSVPLGSLTGPGAREGHKDLETLRWAKPIIVCNYPSNQP